MGDPVIVSALRTPVGKAKKGTFVSYRPDDLAAAVIKGLAEKAPSVPADQVDDIVMGCAMPEGEQGMNAANIAKFVAGIPHTVSAMTVNRFCASGLQAIVSANDSITLGRTSVAIAGGMESMSMVPLGGERFAPNPTLVESCPEAYMSMGHTAERVAEKYGISREDQDRFSCESHAKAAKAVMEGKFQDEIVPISFEYTSLDANSKKITKTLELKVDEGVRADTNVEILSTLRTVFKKGGTVTAGTSSQMSDGAGAVLVMSKEKADAFKLKPIARLVTYAVAGVPPEVMGIGPVAAIPKALKLAGLGLKDIGLIELNEAFASQSLAVIKELKIDPSIVNVNGGAIALGHPLGGTGAILTVKLLHEMMRRKTRYGMVTMCIGGGMGAAGIFENLTMGGSAKAKPAKKPGKAAKKKTKKKVSKKAPKKAPKKTPKKKTAKKAQKKPKKQSKPRRSR